MLESVTQTHQTNSTIRTTPHLCECLVVEGSFVDPNLFVAADARLEEDDVSGPSDFSQSFDLRHYKKAIERGFSIEPKIDEAI